MEKLYYKVSEAAEIMGVTVNRLNYYLARDKKNEEKGIPPIMCDGITVNGCRVWSKEEIELMMDNIQKYKREKTAIQERLKTKNIEETNSYRRLKIKYELLESENLKLKKMIEEALN